MDQKLTKQQYRIRILVFTLLFAALFVLAGRFFLPYWGLYNNGTAEGFYTEPKNSLNVIFLGPSTTAHNVVPTQLYQESGISAYNLGMENQPMLTSYYWLKEAYDYNPESLTTVVLEVSKLVRNGPAEAYEINLGYMRMGRNRYEAIRDFCGITDGKTDLNTVLSRLIPLFRFHSRWSSLEYSDFEQETYPINEAWRGFGPVKRMLIRNESYKDIKVPTYYSDPKAKPPTILSNEYTYYNKIVSFCQEKGLKLILDKGPELGSWTSSNHNVIQKLADRNNLTFIDFNMAPYIDEMGFDPACDNYNQVHNNYYGAAKLTSWFAKYLTENADVTDHRGDEAYEYLEEQAAQFDEFIAHGYKLGEIKDVAEYIKTAAEYDGNTVFIAVKGDGATALTDQQRQTFEELGLHALEELGNSYSYLGVIENGKVIVDTSNGVSTAYQTGLLENGITFDLKSGSTSVSNTAEIRIAGNQSAENKTGINIVVYNEKERMNVDSIVFHTYVASTGNDSDPRQALTDALDAGYSVNQMDSVSRNLYLYDYKADLERDKNYIKAYMSEGGAWQFLSNYFLKTNKIIFLAVKGDAAGAMTAEVRNAFRDLGLKELAELKPNESYACIIMNNGTIRENRAVGIASVSEFGYTVSSTNNSSSQSTVIRVGGSNKSPNEEGLNIVVYDTALDAIADSAAFDTGSVATDLTQLPTVD